MMGRPTKLTPEVQKKIVEAISLGSTYKLSAQYGGVVFNTFNEWMKRGEAAKSGKFREFYDLVKEAEGRAAVGWLAKIEKAASDGNWTAAAWKLERRYPGDYGRQQTEHTGSVEINVSADDELSRRIDSIAERIKASEGDQ